MPGKHYIDSFFLKLVVLLISQKDYVHIKKTCWYRIFFN